MSELSPAAQAVLDTTYNTFDLQDSFSLRKTVAAALRAAVDEVISSMPTPCDDFDENAQGFQSAHIKYRNQFLAIAYELEAQ